jgi:hypothetical protein
MRMEEFNNLDEERKRLIIFDADKVSEKLIDSTKYELFAIQDFFIETKTSISYDFKRTISTYTINNLPVRYASEIN